jgi:hypothetical protein
MAKSLAEQMVEKLAAILLENAGLAAVTVDGTSVTYQDLEERYQFWQKRLQAERGQRPNLSTIKMGGV